MPRSKAHFEATDAVASVGDAPNVHAKRSGDDLQALTRGQKAALSRKRNELSQAIDDLNNEPKGTRRAKSDALKNAVWMAGQGSSRKRAAPPAAADPQVKTKKSKAHRSDSHPQLQARTYRPPVINTTSDNDDNTAESLVRKTGNRSVNDAPHGAKGKAKADAGSENTHHANTEEDEGEEGYVLVDDAGDSHDTDDEFEVVADNDPQNNSVAAQEPGVAGLADEQEVSNDEAEEDSEHVESDDSILAKKPSVATEVLANERPVLHEQNKSELNAVKKKAVALVHNRMAGVSSDEDLPASPTVMDALNDRVVLAPRPRPLRRAIIQPRAMNPGNASSNKENVLPIGAEPMSAEGSKPRPMPRPLHRANVQPCCDAPDPIQVGLGTMVVASHVASEGDSTYWTKAARLFFNSIGEINLRDQSIELRVVIQSAIHKITSWIIFKDSFPTVMTRAIWNREALLAAANDFMEATREGPLKENYRAIHERANLDPNFVKHIGKLPDARISIYRGAYKSACVQIVANYYDLKEGPGCAEKVVDLLSENKYIFRLTPNNQPIGHKPFEHPAITEVIKQRLFDDTRHPINEEFPEYFKDGDKLTPAVVAFAATAIRAAIQEWSTGKRIAQEFTAHSFTDVYLAHMSLLNVIQKLNARGHEHLMLRLFRIASSNRVRRALGTAYLDVHHMQTADSDV